MIPNTDTSQKSKFPTHCQFSVIQNEAGRQLCSIFLGELLLPAEEEHAAKSPTNGHQAGWQPYITNESRFGLPAID